MSKNPVISNISSGEKLHSDLSWVDTEVNGQAIKGEITKLCDVIYKLVNVESKEIDPSTGEYKH